MNDKVKTCKDCKHYPVGRNLHKSEQEITDKTFETIAAVKAMLDVEAVKAAMNLATKRENRFNNAD